jgi:hypothetical protein
VTISYDGQEKTIRMIDKPENKKAILEINNSLGDREVAFSVID